MRTKFLPVFMAILLMVFLLQGCQNQTGDTSLEENVDTTGLITLSKTSITTKSSAVEIDKNKATITSPGTYTIRGTLSNGQIIVDTSGTVTIVLDNVNISCLDSAPFYVKEAGEIILNLADGTKNIFTDSTNYTYTGAETEPDATIFSRADLVIKGQGALHVNANYNDGITSRDTLRIESGDVTIVAKKSGIKGKDYFMQSGGRVRINAGDDGIKATNDTQISFGYVEFNGGDIEINAKDEGISAISKVTINGGNVSIYSKNNGIKSNDLIDLQGGKISIEAKDKALVCENYNTTPNAELIVNGKRISLE